jgi:molybdopterin converting factor small subunit
LPPAKVKLEFWIGDRLGWDHPGPKVLEEWVEEGEPLRSLLNRLAKRLDRFPETVFDPETQSLSSEVALVLNDHIQNLTQGLETPLREGDRVIFLPILAGG